MKKAKAEKAIQKVAMKEGITVEEVRTEIKKAILTGLSNQKPEVREKWKMILCKEETPTLEELITCMAESVKARL